MAGADAGERGTVVCGGTVGRRKLTGNGNVAASYHPRLGCSRRGKSSLITEGCQSAVGEDDGIIQHFPCVFFIRPVLFLFQVLGKQNRSWGLELASPGNNRPAKRRGTQRGVGPNAFLMETMICKVLFIPLAI